MRYVNGEAEMVQLIDRSLKREMSVIFIDFVPVSDSILDEHAKVKIPFDLTLRFNKVKSPERRFMLKRETRELTHGFIGNYFDSWNGLNGITVPPVDLRFDGKGVTINAFAIAGNKPPRYPVVELVPDQDSGKLYFCQLLTDGRLDPAVKPMRNHPEKAAYDPMAVQFLLNLISASVGDNLLK